MKPCPKCGQQAPDAAKFCRACGSPLAQASSSAQQMPPRLLTHLPPAVAEDQEVPPPPPEHGLSFSWGRDPQGRMQRVVEQPGGGGFGTTAGNSPSPETPGSPPPAAGTLPPAPVQWKFREQTSAWADSIAGKIPNPAILRAVRGALLHRTVYRDVAQRPELNNEAYIIAAALIAAGFVGVVIFGWFSVGLLVRMAILRVAGWACAVFAIQAAAKAMHKIDLPPTVWFRALIYAQTPGVLSIIPPLSIVGGIWSAVSSAAAIHDVTGRDTATAIALTVIGGIAATVGTYLLNMILP